MLKIFDEVRAGCAVGPKREHIDEIVRLMTVPLIQGSIRYAYKLSKYELADREGNDKFEKEWGEGWAFLAAVIAQIDNCDTDVSALLVKNMGPATNVSDVMKDGYEMYRDAIRSTLKCLGMTCTDIGELGKAVESGAAGESTCTCDNYADCAVAPDMGPGRWWTIKEAADYSTDAMVHPVMDTCSSLTPPPTPSPTPSPTTPSPTPAPTASPTTAPEPEPDSFAVVLSLLLVLVST
jgi:hypothetical protein